MAGFIGGLVSSVAGPIAGLFGGNSAKTDRSNQLAGMKGLNNVLNWGLPFGQQQAQRGAATTQTGLEDVDQATSWAKKLMSGNRPQMLQAIAPETAAIQSQDDAAKRQLAASGTARGGGAAAVNQQRESQKMSEIDRLLFGAQRAGAEMTGRLGATAAGLGLDQTGKGLQAESLAAQSGASLADIGMRSRELSQQIHNQTVKQFTDAFDNALGLIFGGDKNTSTANANPATMSIPTNTQPGVTNMPYWPTPSSSGGDTGWPF